MGQTMDLACEANVKKVDLTAKLKKSQVVRLMKIKLLREFDVLMARAIGGDADEVLASLRSGGLEKGVIPIDSIVARIELAVVGVGAGKTDKVLLPKCLGRKATASAAKGEDDVQPTIELEFEFAFSEEAWAWFGRNTGGYATIEIKPAQLALRKAS